MFGSRSQRTVNKYSTLNEPRAPYREFDLRRASVRLGPFVRRFRRDSFIGIVFLAVFGLVIFGVSWSSITRGALSGYQAFDLAVVAVMVVGGVSLLLWQLRRHVLGAVSLEVNDHEFELVYPSGKRTVVSWSDPSLEFTLLDFTGADPSVLRTAEYPYRISIQGIESLLTNEAYEALASETKRLGLDDAIERGSTWRYPARAIPTIHRIHAR